MNNDKPGWPSDQEGQGPDKQGNSGGMLDDFAEESYADAEEPGIPLEELQIPKSAPPAVQKLKPKMPSLMELTKTKIDMDAIRNVSAKVSKKVESLLHKTVEDRAVRSAPGELKPLKLITNYKNSPPCGQKWGEAAGEERIRSCGRCQLRVYNFRDMDQGEAEDLVSRMEGGAKPKLFKRGDGKFLSTACPVGRRIKLYKVVPFAVSLVLFSLMGALLWLTPSARVIPTSISLTSFAPALHPDSARGDALSPQPGANDVAARKKERAEIAVSSRNEKVVSILEHDDKQISDALASQALPVPGGGVTAHRDKQIQDVEDSMRPEKLAK